MAIAKILADFNLVVQYGIAIHIYASKKFWQLQRQRAILIPTKFSGYFFLYIFC